MSRNDEVAARLEEFADLLAATGVEYKPRAYRRAAENVRETSAAVEGLAAEGEDAVAEIDGVGDAISPSAASPSTAADVSRTFSAARR